MRIEQSDKIAVFYRAVKPQMNRNNRGETKFCHARKIGVARPGGLRNNLQQRVRRDRRDHPISASIAGRPAILPSIFGHSAHAVPRPETPSVKFLTAMRGDEMTCRRDIQIA